MIKCIKKPYIGEKIKKKSRKFLHNLIHQKKQYIGYVITLPVGGDGLLHLYPVYVLNQSYYQKQNIMVVGIAKDKQEALLLVQDIVNECYGHTGDIQVGSYLLANEKNFDI